MSARDAAMQAAGIQQMTGVQAAELANALDAYHDEVRRETLHEAADILDAVDLGPPDEILSGTEMDLAAQTLREAAEGEAKS